MIGHAALFSYAAVCLEQYTPLQNQVTRHTLIFTGSVCVCVDYVLILSSLLCNELCMCSSMESNFTTLKILTLIVHAGLFWCFHNPLNSNIYYRIFSLTCRCYLFTCIHTQGFIVSSEGLFVVLVQ